MKHLRNLIVLAFATLAVLYAVKKIGYVHFLTPVIATGAVLMKRSYTTSAGETVHTIYAYNRLTAMHGRREITYFVPQHLRGEVNCAMRRPDWQRMADVIDRIDECAV